MTDITFAVIWLVSFFIYLGIYTWHIPKMTQIRIEDWLKSSESDQTLEMSLDVITKKIREQMLIDFEEFMLPQARESLQKFWSGAMGNVAKEMKNSEEGSNLHMMHNMAKELEGQPWYVQMLGSKLLPIITDAAKTQTKPKETQILGMGLQE